MLYPVVSSCRIPVVLNDWYLAEGESLQNVPWFQVTELKEANNPLQLCIIQRTCNVLILTDLSKGSSRIHGANLEGWMESGWILLGAVDVLQSRLAFLRKRTLRYHLEPQYAPLWVFRLVPQSYF